MQEEKPKMQKSDTQKAQNAEKSEENEQIHLSKAEKFVISAIYHKSADEKISELKDKISYFDNLFSEEASKLLKLIQCGANSTELLDKCKELTEDVGEIIVIDNSQTINISQEVEDCIRLLQKDYLSKKQEQLTKQIDAEPEREKRQALLEELTKITKERNLYKL